LIGCSTFMHATRVNPSQTSRGAIIIKLHLDVEPSENHLNISKDDISLFQKLVLGWAGQHGRSFPWRRARESHYRVVVTELLLQRTKAETVRNYYGVFFSQFPNWKALAQAPKTEIGNALKPLGLWQRKAPVLKQLANEMVARNGRFPQRREQIDSLSGVGQYIGNAIELLCQHRSKPLLDASMARVLERYFGPRMLVDIRHDSYLQALSHHVVDHDQAREINWAILDLGALVCRNRSPSCGECKLRMTCKTGQATTV